MKIYYTRVVNRDTHNLTIALDDRFSSAEELAMSPNHKGFSEVIACLRLEERDNVKLVCKCHREISQDGWKFYITPHNDYYAVRN